MKKLLLFLSLLSLIPGIKGQQTPDRFGLEDVSAYPLSAADLEELIAAGYDPRTGQFVPSAPAPASAPSDTSEANAILYQCHQCLQIFNTQNELDQHEIDHLLFPGLDIDTTVFGEPSSFDEPLPSLNNSVPADQVFAAPAAPAHASATAQGPVSDRRITKGSRLDLASSQASAQRNACIICGATFKEKSLFLQHMKKHNNDTLAASAVESKKSSATNPLTHLTQTQQNIEQQGTELLLPTVATNQSFQLAPIITSKLTTEEKEETGDDESYSADPEYQDYDDQSIASAKNTTNKASFKCSTCEETFTQSYICLRHIKNKHDGNAKVIEIGETISSPHKCLFDGCTRSFPTKFGLEQHQRKTHGNSLYNRNQLPSEILLPLQNENGLWDCPYQDKDNPLQKCPYRNHPFTRIIQHLPVHTEEKNFQCSECKECYTTNSNCSKHIGRKHKGQGTVLEVLPLAPICNSEGGIAGVIKKGSRNSINHNNVCSQCGQSFRWKKILERHIAQKHSSERNYPCPYCEKRFAHDLALNSHKRTHNPEQCLRCTYQGCTVLCKNPSTLEKHIRTHTGEKPFKCTHPNCEKSFAQIGNLNAHIKKDH